MWTSKTKSLNEREFDKVVEITHEFGNGVTVVTNFVEKTTKKFFDKIEVEEIDLINDTEAYTRYLQNIDIEINPLNN